MVISELLATKGVRYKETNKHFVIHCLNPEHEDRNPSLHIDKVTGGMFCFSCGFRGSIFKHFGLDIAHQVDTRVLALRAKLEKLISPVMSIPLDRTPFFQDYRNISKKTYEYFGAFLSQEYPDRVCFPIINPRGDLVMIITRSLFSDVKPKYVLYPKHTQPPIWPFKPSTAKKTVYLVEGIFDVLNLWDKGITNVVTSWGLGPGLVSSKKSKDELERFSALKVLGIEKIIVAYDNDQAGNSAAERLIANPLFKREFILEKLDLPEGKDPGSLTREEIKELFI